MVKKAKGLSLILVLTIVLWGIFIFPCSPQSTDKLTIVTYYPSPFGVYNELRSKRMAIGNDYYNNSDYCWGVSCTNIIDPDADLVVEDNVGIGTSNPGSYRLYVNGDMHLTGNLTIGGIIEGGDIAEDIRCPECEPGDVVTINSDDETYKKSNKPYDYSVVGVISKAPSLNLSKIENREDVRPLALVGFVKCKVTTENGLIRRGDLLVTSSKPGCAMRANIEKLRTGMVIGKALETLKEGEGEILILLSLN